MGQLFPEQSPEVVRWEAREALKKNGLKLEFMPPEMQQDPDLVHAAVKNNPQALLFAPDLMNDAQFILGVIDRNNYQVVGKYVGSDLRDCFASSYLDSLLNLRKIVLHKQEINYQSKMLMR